MAVKLSDVKQAERSYSNALMTYGENNLATVRALIRWQDLKREYESKKKGKNPMARPRPYNLTLTESERDAFGFVGGRYSNGTDMIRVLENGLPPDKEWSDPGTITFELFESDAWIIKELAEEDDYQFPLFSGRLADKMMEFIEGIV